MPSTNIQWQKIILWGSWIGFYSPKEYSGTCYENGSGEI